jgi:AbiV family abortive infection protein
MPNKPLKQYNGSLTPPQIAAGINAARRNAARLIEDADILFKQRRWATAATLAILFIEEFGKTYILRTLALVQGIPALQKHWREYRSHTKKNVLGLFPELVRKGAHSLEDFQPIFDLKAAHPHQIEQIKQLSIYTDCYFEGCWSEPEMVVDEQLSEYLLRTAKLIMSTHEVSAREIELWIEHVGSSLTLDPEQRKAAIIDWYTAMKEEKLFKNEDIDISHFIWPFTNNPNAEKEDV